MNSNTLVANQKERTLTAHLGIIEGFYGKPWGFAKREAMIPFMKTHGYGFYLYAPKADVYLRDQWQEAFPEALSTKLSQLGERFHEQGIAWGLGLSPMGLHEHFDSEGKAKLETKLEQIKALNCDYLAILFDDMKGDFPKLAQSQIEICHFIKEKAGISKLIMCPSYYSYDPILEKVFGKMPKDYWTQLGKGLDPDIDIFWTGEKVCSPSYSQSHLEEVARLFQRKPTIWDNYPVNDGARMSPFLHLSKVKGRESCNAEAVTALAVNPMNEAFLSQIPMAGIAEVIAHGEGKIEEDIFAHHAQCLGKAAEEFIKDRSFFEELGLKELPEETRNLLATKYELLSDEDNKDYIAELIAYLKGEYLFDVQQDSVPTQALWDES